MIIRYKHTKSAGRKRFFGRLFVRITAILIIAGFASGFLSACQETEPEIVRRPASYGSYGSEIARTLAERWPNRSPGSAQEKAAADYIAAIFEEIGYIPEVMPFTFLDQAGQTRSSQNIIVRIAGSGFTIPDEDDNPLEVSRQVLVGAHYDVKITAEQAEADRLERQETAPSDSEPSETTQNPDGDTDETTDDDTFGSDFILPTPYLSDFDGIHNNASGVAALLTLADQLKDQKYGYDIVLVAFGANQEGLAGSRAFAAEMTPADLERTDVMYNIDSIYAGDKVYAHAGQNSVLPGNQKKYEMRRKLYEVTDVYYENELYTNNRFALYTNQSSVDVPWGYGGLSKAVYREWTLHESDHTPFDKLDIPIVFFESYDYDADNLEAIRESSNPIFVETAGAIAGTPYDSSMFLEKLFAVNTAASTVSSQNSSTSDASDQLERRINNVAFIIEGAIAKGIHNAIEASS